METSFALSALGQSIFSATNASGTTLMAGAAEAVVTPAIEGLKAYDDLYVRALVLADETRRLAIVTTDFLIFHSPYIEALLGAINKASGILPENIAISTSQTHNGPWPDPHFHEPGGDWESRLDISALDDASIPYEEWLADTVIELGPYSRWLATRIAFVVKSAADSLQPATLRAGRAPAMIGYNRRLMKDGRVIMAPNPDGAIVPWVDVLGAYSSDGKRIAVLFSHAAHPVIIHESSQDIGPDFPGYAIKHLRNLLDRDAEPEGIFMFAQGCCGDINGHPLRGGFGACDAAGLSLAFAVTRALAECQTVKPGRLKVHWMDISLPLVDAPPVDECKEQLSQQTDARQIQRYQHLLAIAESGEAQFKPLSMRAFAVGDELCFLSLSGEMFAEYQLFTDKVSPFLHTWVFNHTNGYAGYVATKEDYEFGPTAGYEAWGHPSSVTPWLPPRPASEQVVKDGITRLLRGLKTE